MEPTPLPESDNYRIERLLGLGGMGQVYLAHDRRLDRPVALKILRGADREVARRMVHEARSQAKVSHDNVGKVFEVGELGGKYFIAMQFVDGQPLDVAAQYMTLEEKVSVLRDVADAVQAAHSQSLVHRDLKPANILVENSESEGWHPFVLDFGIAEELEAPGVTTTGTVMGTPNYMAPEQIVGDRARVDHRIDIYSLGVVLYELLSSRLPYEGETAVVVLVKILKEDPFPLGKAAPGLPADLRAIVNKCLDKEPERRYRSARLLAEDLDRFLSGEPVLAQPTSWSYLLKKQIVRHRLAASTALLALVLFFTGGIKYTLDLRAERSAAIEAQREAEEVASFLTDLFEVSDPGESKGSTITARELLDRGAEKMKKDLRDQPLVRAHLLTVIGSVYKSLGLYDEAELLLTESLGLRKESLGPEDHRVAQTQMQMGHTLFWSGDLDRAESFYQNALSLYEETEASPILIANAVSGLANVAHEKGVYERAGSLFERALEIYRLEGDKSLESNALHGLANVHKEKSEYVRALELFEESLTIADQVRDTDDPRTTNTLSVMGLLLREMGRDDRALEVYNRSLEIRRRLYGDRSSKVATVLNNLGMIYRANGYYQQAVESYEETVEIYRSTLGEDHYWVGIAYGNLARAYRELGQFSEAEKSVEAALEIYRESVGEDNPKAAIAQFTLALLLLDQGKVLQAREVFGECLAAFEATYGSEHANVATVLVSYARADNESGEHAAAQKKLARALEIREKLFEVDDPRIAAVRTRLAERLEGGEESQVLLDQAVRDLEKRLGNKPGEYRSRIELARAHLVVGKKWQGMGNPSKAADGWRQSREILESIERERWSGEAWATYGEILLAQGEVGLAEPVLRHLEVLGWGLAPSRQPLDSQ